MKKKSLVVIFILVSGFVAPLLIHPSASVDPGTVSIAPVTLTGTLNEDNPDDYYGLRVTEPGTYNFSVYSTGETDIVAWLNVYIQGSPLWDMMLYSNSSQLWNFRPGRDMNYNRQIHVRTINEFEEVSYVVKLERIHDLPLVGPNDEQSYIFEPYESTWYIFDASAATNAYNFTVYNNGTWVYWTILDENGLTIASYTQWGNRSHIIMLDPGQYYVRFTNDDPDPGKVWAVFEPNGIPVITPGMSETVHLNYTINAQRRHVFNLDLKEGVYYDMELEADGGVDGGFRIYKGPSTASYYHYFNYFGPGEEENISDIVFFGQNSMYLGWDYNLSWHPEQTFSVQNFLWGSDQIDHSRIILEIFCSSGDGDATFRINSETPVPSIDGVGSTICNFNNTIGPFYHLVNVSGLSGMSLYKFTFDHLATLNNNMTSDIYLHAPRKQTDQNYLYRHRPYYPVGAKEAFDRQLVQGYGHFYSYDFNEEITTPWYQSIDGNIWAVVRVPDMVYMGSYTGAPPLFGQVNVSVENIASTPLAVGTAETAYPDSDMPSLFTASLVGGHTYKFATKAVNYSSNAYPTIFNSTGYSMTGAYYGAYSYSPWIDDDDVSYAVIHVIEDTDVALTFYVYGDTPVEVWIEDLTPPAPITFMIAILGFVGVGVVCLLIGIVIGRRR
ncbi:MAG: hypothetical protein ACFE7R_00655 [Candidatus Hodarchaeota archaeon]